MKKHDLMKYSETLIVTLIVFGLTVANGWHIFSHVLSPRPDTVFIGISHYHEDYFYYLSQVTQGKMGAWNVRNLYTAEPIAPQPLWWPNIFLGKIAAVFSLPPWTVYDIAVTAAAAASLIAVYAVCRRLYPHLRGMRIATFAVAVTTSAYYTWQRSPPGIWTVVPYRYFYDYTESLNRLGGVFHLILQNILSIIIIVAAAGILKFVFYGTGRQKSFWWHTAVVAVSVFFLAYINPVYIFVDGSAVALTALILLVKRPKLKKLTYLLVSLLVIGIPLMIPAAAMRSALTIPFFRYFRWWEANVQRVTPREFFMSMGPVAILAVIGLVPFLKKGGPLRILGVIWTVFPLTLYFTDYPVKFQIPFFRLPQPPQYIIIGALATEALSLPSLLLTKLRLKKAAAFLFTILITGWVAWQLPMIVTEVRARTNNFALNSWLNYMDPKFIEGLSVLTRQPDTKLVLAINNTELVIPVITGRTVYVGHHSLTLNYPEKIVNDVRFFQRSMTAPEAAAFLGTNNIGYIVWRNADGNPKILPQAYPFLKTFYANEAVTIFTP